MAPAAPSPHVGDVATSTAASHINGSGPPEKFVNSTNMTGTTESFRSSDSNPNLFASVDGLDDGGQQNIYAAQVINSQVLPGFLPQNQFVPVPFVPSPYGHLIEPPRFCAKCGRDAVQDVIGAGEHQTRQQKNPFSQTERRNPFQHNPFQKGHEEKRRAPPNTPARGDVWKEGDEGCGIKIRKEDDQPDTQESAWKPGRGCGRNPFTSTANHSTNQFKGREPRDSEQREKFRKPAPQCPQWEDRHHRVNNNCPLWHPYKMCLFYPNCRSTALDCGYAHPFCSENECDCTEENKDPQLNHWTGTIRSRSSVLFLSLFARGKQRSDRRRFVVVVDVADVVGTTGPMSPHLLRQQRCDRCTVPR
uniref:C3H1-type domain-containing protein n=1 Tax=Angiostrongylus cantonensis TaxID=6313 RepID=A0A158PAE7_ANGCA